MNITDKETSHALLNYGADKAGKTPGYISRIISYKLPAVSKVIYCCIFSQYSVVFRHRSTVMNAFKRSFLPWYPQTPKFIIPSYFLIFFCCFLKKFKFCIYIRGVPF